MNLGSAIPHLLKTGLKPSFPASIRHSTFPIRHSSAPHTPSPLHVQGQLDPPPQKQFPSSGAYQRNKARRYGLLDEQEEPDAENVALITAVNRKAAQWMMTQD